jgi:5-methylthioribose kinase
MKGPQIYEPLTPESLASRLGGLEALTNCLGDFTDQWQVEEIGDGNLNLVFLVRGAKGAAIVKQALPYIRLVGESWPLPLNRAYFEYHALIRQAERDPGSVPEVLYFDEDQALIVMEFLDQHVILRSMLIAGAHVNNLGTRLGQFIARTAFRGSDLALPIVERKSDTKLFLDNHALCNITESLVFTDPYHDAELNHHNPAVDGVVADLRQNIKLKAEAQALLTKFVANSETMLHGDLHTGSVMCTEDSIRVIDPEFATYGPMGFDLGMMLANFVMAYISQPAHRSPEDLASYQGWILDVIKDLVAAFNVEFSTLWHAERRGVLFPHSLFEDQQHDASLPLQAKQREIWEDALGFCGIEMHRRTLTLAHNADFEAIEDASFRGELEAQNLKAGAQLIIERHDIADVDAFLAAIQATEAAG